MPIEPSLFGLPTSWHFRHPLFTAAGPSISAIAMRRAVDGALVELLGEGDLLGGEVPLARSPPPRPAPRGGCGGTARTRSGGTACSWPP